jgi:hypothetical protein
VETLEKEKQPPDRDLSRKLDEVSAKRAAQKEVVFQKEMEAREIGKIPGGWQRFLLPRGLLRKRSSSRRRWRPEKSVRPLEAGRRFFWSRGRSPGEAFFQKKSKK